MRFVDQVESLVKASNCDDYRINSAHEVRYEAYFVKNSLDIIRKVELENCTVVVYKDSDEGTKRGSAEVILNAAYSNEEMRKKIEEACHLASLVKEPYYPLPKGLHQHQEATKSNLKEQITQIASALSEYEVKENEALNSFEIFAKETHHTVLNSQGLDVTYTSNSNNIEVIVNVNDEGHEVEIYHADTFAIKAKEEIQADLKRILQYGQDKMIAKPLDVEGNRIVICNRDVSSLLRYIMYQINSYSMYAKMSNVKVGEPFFTKEVTGDTINLRVCKRAEGASSNPPCNSEGVLLKDAYLIKEGKVCNIIGVNQYGHYLNQEIVPTIHRVFEGGKYSESELKKEPYLECVEFSDFSVDPMNGDFAGEIRLAYYFDGQTITPYTKGSVSGNLKELGTQMYFSKETNNYDGDILPKCVFIKGANIAKGV